MTLHPWSLQRPIWQDTIKLSQTTQLEIDKGGIKAKMFTCCLWSTSLSFSWWHWVNRMSPPKIKTLIVGNSVRIWTLKTRGLERRMMTCKREEGKPLLCSLMLLVHFLSFLAWQLSLHQLVSFQENYCKWYTYIVFCLSKQVRLLNIATVEKPMPK